MMNIKKFCAALALTLIATGCGTQFGGNYSGSWTATQNGTPLTNTVFSMTLYQTGSTVNGFWQATGTSVAPVSGSITGTTSGSTVQATLVAPPNGLYAGTFQGTLTLSNTMLTGQVTGTMTAGGTFTGTPILTQQR